MKKQNPDTKLYDLRLVERNITASTLSKKDYEAYLNTLPDDEASAEYSVVDLSDAEDDPLYPADIND